MRKFGGVTTAIGAAFLLGIVATTLTAAPLRAATFDGVWSVAIDTSVGNCGNYRAALQIFRGRVQAVGTDFTASGSVGPSGATVVTVRSSQGSATGTGVLRGAAGGGRWRSSTGECSGTWAASRRDY